MPAGSLKKVVNDIAVDSAISRAYSDSKSKAKICWALEDGRQLKMKVHISH
jgi:hypothetical protein